MKAYASSAHNAHTSAYAPRSLHLVDVENLVGGTQFSEADVAAAEMAYGDVVAVAGSDLVVVASSHFTALPTWFGWHGPARRVVRSGPDGADLALLDVLETENVAVRFDRVVIASGDRIFAEPVARLYEQGLHVTVVSRPQALSRQLRLATRDVRLLSSTPVLGPVALAQRAA